MSCFDNVQEAATWVGRAKGASRVWLRQALPGVVSKFNMNHLTLALHEAADAQVKATAAGHPSQHGGSNGPVDEPGASVEQALIFSKEAAAMERFPVRSIPEGVDDDALKQPWTIYLTIDTAYSGRGSLQQHWDLRSLQRVVQAVPVHVTDRQRLLTREI